MNLTNKLIAGTLAGLGLASAAHAYGPAEPKSATAVPSGYTKCADDGKVCTPAAGVTVLVYWGANGKFTTATGTGAFTCLAAGWQKDKSKPADLGVADPASGVAKSCYIPTSAMAAAATTSTATTAKPATTATQAASTPAPALVVPACNAYKETIFNAKAKEYKTTAELAGNYAKNQTMATTSAAAATDCAKFCGAMGEPAPCAWFSVTKFLSTVGGKDTIAYSCHMFNDRSLKQISTPSLPKEVNLGTPDSALRFQEAHSYACRN